MRNQNVAQLPNSNQYEIYSEVRPGSGKAAFFVDVRVSFAGHFLLILGCPVWTSNNGGLAPDIPTKPGNKNPSKRFPFIEMDPELWREIAHVIREACEQHRREPGEN